MGPIYLIGTAILVKVHSFALHLSIHIYECIILNLFSARLLENEIYALVFLFYLRKHIVAIITRRQLLVAYDFRRLFSQFSKGISVVSGSLVLRAVYNLTRVQLFDMEAADLINVLTAHIETGLID